MCLFLICLHIVRCCTSFNLFFSPLAGWGFNSIMTMVTITMAIIIMSVIMMLMMTSMTNIMSARTLMMMFMMPKSIDCLLSIGPVFSSTAERCC